MCGRRKAGNVAGMCVCVGLVEDTTGKGRAGTCLRSRPPQKSRTSLPEGEDRDGPPPSSSQVGSLHLPRHCRYSHGGVAGQGRGVGRVSPVVPGRQVKVSSITGRLY